MNTIALVGQCMSTHIRQYAYPWDRYHRGLLCKHSDHQVHTSDVYHSSFQCNDKKEVNDLAGFTACMHPAGLYCNFSNYSRTFNGNYNYVLLYFTCSKIMNDEDVDIIAFIVQLLLRKENNSEYLSVLGNSVRSKQPKGGLKKLFLRHPQHFIFTERY